MVIVVVIGGSRMGGSRSLAHRFVQETSNSPGASRKSDGVVLTCRPEMVRKDLSKNKRKIIISGYQRLINTAFKFIIVANRTGNDEHELVVGGASLVDILPRPDTPGGPWKARGSSMSLSRHHIRSVHRPNIIFGFSPRGAINIVCSLCVYAAICRKEGVPLRWPGSRGGWVGFITASDADLIAEHHIWVGVDPMAKNEAFNCSNGDVCTWEKMWPILAGRFVLEWVGYEGEENRFKMSQAMVGKEAVWAEIVEENGLAPTNLSEVVANWWVIDVLGDQFGLDREILDSMNKSKEHGFLGFRNTFKSFNTCIDSLRAHKIVP